MCKHQLNYQNVYLASDERVLSVNVVVLVYYIMLSYLLSAQFLIIQFWCFFMLLSYSFEAYHI